MTCLGPKCNRKRSLNSYGLCPDCEEIRKLVERTSNPTEAPENNHEVPDQNLSEVNHIFQKLKRGESLDQRTIMTALFGGILGLSAEITNIKTHYAREIENVKTKVTQIEVETKAAIEALERKVGAKEEFAVPCSIAFTNLSKSPTKDDETLVKEILHEVNATNVDVQNDIVKVKRIGANEHKHGTVLVEIGTVEKKIQIMRTKKHLLKHQNMNLRKIQIRNMKTQDQMNFENAIYFLLSKLPDGNQFIVSNGKIKPKQNPQH